MGAMASQITSHTIVYSTAYSVADQKKISKPRDTGICVGNSPVTGETADPSTPPMRIHFPVFIVCSKF